MKNKTWNIILIIIVVVTTSMVSAQGQRPMGPPPIPDEEQIEKMLVDLSEILSLSEPQIKDVSEVYYANFEEMRSVQKEGNSARGAMKKLEADLEKKVNALLSPEQQKLYEAWLKEQKSQRKRPERP